MCWACYAPLSDGKHSSDLRKKENRRKVWRGMMEAAPPMAILFLFGASGWVPREYGGYFLAVAVGVPVLSLLIEGVQRLRNRFKVAPEPPPKPKGPLLLDPHAITNGAALADEEPIVRIAGTVILYALKDGADTIRLSHGVRGVRVQYHIGSEWVEQMKIPGYVWKPLRDYLWELPVPSTDGIPTEDFIAILEDKSYRMHLVYETDDLSDHLVIGINPLDHEVPDPAP